MMVVKGKILMCQDFSLSVGSMKNVQNKGV